MYLSIVRLFVFVFCGIVYGAEADQCTTPNGETATCISLFSCPGLMKALGSLEKYSVQYVHKSICRIEGTDEWYVCCAPADRIPPQVPLMGRPTSAPTPTRKPTKKVTKTPTPTPTPNTEKPNSDAPQNNKDAQRKEAKKLLAQRSFCGAQHTDDRFYNDTQTAIDEFPWLVHIKITDVEYEYEYGDRCSGVLISNRYVLTDAYCAYHAKKVIVGEHKTDTNVSCALDATLLDCTDPTAEVRVEEIIRDGRKENGPYDLALLRLNKTLSFTDYIRPLCLPFEESERPNKSTPLIFSGWGSKGPGVIIKKRVVYDQTDNQECFNASVGLEGNVIFANVTLLCAKPRKTNIYQSCSGDHGGALMYSRRSQWFAESIVVEVLGQSFSCTENLPASSIKITQKNLDWILDTVKK